MAQLRPSDQRRAVQDFFNSEIRNLESASRAVTRTTARALKRETAKQLRRFKRGRHSTGNFQKAVKVYDVEPRGVLGPASYTRLGVPFMGVFQEGSTIQGKPRLAILLPSGEALGYRRISKGNPWPKVLAQMQRYPTNVFYSGDRSVFAINKGGKWVGIYLFISQVKEPKKLSFYEMAEELANQMPDQIANLLDGNFNV
jgi:hypothetical protein